MQNTPILTLREIFQIHEGKVSDKWSSYLDEYERLFCEFKQSSISLLEIGVQNGGSMEIWGKYFTNARSLTGCDINEKCRNLKFDDERITVIVGDANSDLIQSKIEGISEQFDIIIDDGSHKSGDIVKSFARYFPKLTKGGVFLAEDLHCSYWKDFEGGLFDPLSSMTFFKDLSDIVNHEHWGIPEARKVLLETYRLGYGVEFAEQDLAEIKSIEFLNSICVVRKKEQNNSGLGVRCRSGLSAEVFSLEKLPSNTATITLTPDQTGNTWSQSEWFRERVQIAQASMEITDLAAEISRLKREFDEKQVQLDERQAQLDERQAQLDGLKSALNQADRQIEILKHNISLRENSISWRLTSPLRAIKDVFTAK